MDKDFIKRIAEPVGGMIALARALNLSKAAVYQWKRVPAERVIDVERLTGVSREQLRPDIFGKCQ